MTIMTIAKRHSPIINPMAACIAKIQPSQIRRVLFKPNENWVTHLEQTNRNAEQSQSVFKLNQKIRRDWVKWRADQ
jgi:hypothetical protein